MPSSKLFSKNGKIITNKQFGYTCILLFNFVCITGGRAVAQITGAHHSVAIGWANGTLKDAFLDTASFKGGSTTFSYSYVMEGNRRRTALSGVYALGRYDQTGKGTKISSASFILSDGFSVFKNRHAPFKAYLGYALSATPEWLTGTGKSSNAFSWDNLMSVGFYQCYIYGWKTNSFSAEINIPLASLTYRPRQAYIAYDQEKANMMMNAMFQKSDFATFDKYKAAFFSLGYTNHIANHLNLTVKYNFDYRELNTGSPFLIRTNGAAVSLVYDCGRFSSIN